MAATNVVKDGLEGYLYWAENPDEVFAKGTGTANEWTLLGYVNDFGFTTNPNTRAVYDHYDITHYKKGRVDNTGTLGQLYTNKTGTVLGLEGKTIALKLEICDDGDSDAPTEAFVLNNVRIGEVSFRMPETGDMTATATFQFGKVTVTEPTA